MATPPTGQNYLPVLAGRWTDNQFYASIQNILLWYVSVEQGVPVPASPYYTPMLPSSGWTDVDYLTSIQSILVTWFQYEAFTPPLPTGQNYTPVQSGKLTKNQLLNAVQNLFAYLILTTQAPSGSGQNYLPVTGGTGWTDNNYLASIQNICVGWVNQQVGPLDPGQNYKAVLAGKWQNNDFLASIQNLLVFLINPLT